MKKRGEMRKMRFVEWTGPMPQPGEGLEFATGRRYVIAEVRKTDKMKAGTFYITGVVLGPEDPDPAHVHPCYSVPRGGR